MRAGSRTLGSGPWPQQAQSLPNGEAEPPQSCQSLLLQEGLARARSGETEPIAPNDLVKIGKPFFCGTSLDHPSPFDPTGAICCALVRLGSPTDLKSRCVG